MGKKWLCDKGCNKTIQWPEPYKAGNKPVNTDGTPHNCLPGGPDHVAGQVASAPASAPPTTEQNTLEDNKGDNIGQSLENKLYDNAEIITIEIIKRSIAYTQATMPMIDDKAEVHAMRELFAHIMAQVIAK